MLHTTSGLVDIPPCAGGTTGTMVTDGQRWAQGGGSDAQPSLGTARGQGADLGKALNQTCPKLSILQTDTFEVWRNLDPNLVKPLITHKML